MFIFLVQKCHTLLLLVLFSILLFGFLFLHVHHLCMPLLGPELVNKFLYLVCKNQLFLWRDSYVHVHMYLFSEPQICFNAVNPKNGTYGYFICPEAGQPDNYDYCCGEEGDQRCCGFFDE